jgi:hypothetical protein
MEETAVRVTDAVQLQRLAAMWKSRFAWPFEVSDDALRDDHGRLRLFFGVAPTRVLSFGKEPNSQTRYRSTA